MKPKEKKIRIRVEKIEYCDCCGEGITGSQVITLARFKKECGAKALEELLINKWYEGDGGEEYKLIQQEI